MANTELGRGSLYFGATAPDECGSTFLDSATSPRTLKIQTAATGAGTGPESVRVASAAAADTAAPSGAAGGDLSGTYPNPTVAKVAGVTPSAFVLTILDDADAATVRATIGAGTGSGTVTSVGGTSPIASSGGATPAISLNDAGVTNAKLSDMAQDTFKGRASGAGTGVPVDLTAGQAAAILNTLLQAKAEKGAASGYADLNSASRTTKGVVAIDDVIIDLASKGLVLKDIAGTPHYWRISVSTLGVLSTSDLGTSLP